jgi:hypothetical protein
VCNVAIAYAVVCNAALNMTIDCNMSGVSKMLSSRLLYFHSHQKN